MSDRKTNYTSHFFLFLNNPIKSWIDAVVKSDTTRLFRILRKNTTRSKKNGKIIFLKRKCKTKQRRIHTITGRSVWSRRRSESLPVANLEKSHNEETQNRKSERSNRVHFPIKEYEKALQKMGNEKRWAESFVKQGMTEIQRKLFHRRCRNLDMYKYICVEEAGQVARDTWNFPRKRKVGYAF